MPEKEAGTYHINPVDLTKVWPHRDYLLSLNSASRFSTVTPRITLPRSSRPPLILKADPKYGEGAAQDLRPEDRGGHEQRTGDGTTLMWEGLRSVFFLNILPARPSEPRE
jgi:hypothetical protein